MKDKIGKYYGPDKIKKVEEVKDKHSLKSKVYKLTFENGSNNYVTDRCLELFANDKEIDASSFRELKFRAIMPSIQMLLLEYGVKRGEIQPLSISIAENMLNSFDDATSYLWTGNRSEFVSGFDPLREIDYIHTDIILSKSVKNKKNE